MVSLWCIVQRARLDVTLAPTVDQEIAIRPAATLTRPTAPAPNNAAVNALSNFSLALNSLLKFIVSS